LNALKILSQIYIHGGFFACSGQIFPLAQPILNYLLQPRAFFTLIAPSQPLYIFIFMHFLRKTGVQF